MTAAVGAPNFFNFDAGVVHALMEARYQSSSRGQFISEDPLFLGDPKRQALIDPQSLNSYSYANDNPITKSDPSGRCLEDGCIIEGAAAFGFAGGIAAQAFHDYTTGDFSRRSIGQNILLWVANWQLWHKSPLWCSLAQIGRHDNFNSCAICSSWRSICS
jgi:RHS repeat-associated protein